MAVRRAQRHGLARLAGSASTRVAERVPHGRPPGAPRSSRPRRAGRSRRSARGAQAASTAAPRRGGSRRAPRAAAGRSGEQLGERDHRRARDVGDHRLRGRQRVAARLGGATRRSTPLARALRIVASTASGSVSIAHDRRRSRASGRRSRAPRSRSRRRPGSRPAPSTSSARQPRVVACWPVPNAIPGSIDDVGRAVDRVGPTAGAPALAPPPRSAGGVARSAVTPFVGLGAASTSDGDPAVARAALDPPRRSRRPTTGTHRSKEVTPPSSRSPHPDGGDRGTAHPAPRPPPRRRARPDGQPDEVSGRRLPRMRPKKPVASRSPVVAVLRPAAARISRPSSLVTAGPRTSTTTRWSPCRATAARGSPCPQHDVLVERLRAGRQLDLRARPRRSAPSPWCRSWRRPTGMATGRDDVEAVAHEALVGGDAHLDVQVAGRRPRVAGVPAARTDGCAGRRRSRRGRRTRGPSPRACAAPRRGTRGSASIGTLPSPRQRRSTCSAARTGRAARG